MEEVKNTIEQVAETNATVLIRGQSGRLASPEVPPTRLFRKAVL
jgi:hypothetical protein